MNINDSIDFDTLSIAGKHYIPVSFFKNRYHHNNTEQFLDNYQEFITYQTETTGDFSTGNQQTFSINGNSHKWNRYYFNNMRTDDRFFPGNSLHKADLYNNSTELDIWNSSLNFLSENSADNDIMFRYNHGGLGGPFPFTEDLVHLFHSTAKEKTYIKIYNQRKIENSGSIWFNYQAGKGDKKYHHSFSADYGRKMIPDFSYMGLNEYYSEDYLQLNFKGEIPLVFKNLFHSSHYVLSINDRDNLFSEYYYSFDETAKYKNINATVYGIRNSEIQKLTSGINFSYKNIKHNDLNFSRNFIDQDGEGVEPWYPDGGVSEISHSLVSERKMIDNFSFCSDNYNSLINFKPLNSEFFNTVYYQMAENDYKSLYLYEWNSAQFVSGLIENTEGVKYSASFLKNKMSLLIRTDATFDGMLIKGKSRAGLNWQSEFSLYYRPYKFLSIALNSGRKRVPYNFDHIRFLSDDYMNGNIYYWNDLNSDKIYQSGEKSDFFTSTGGTYHSVSEGVRQPAYFYFEIPVKLNFGKSSFSLFNQYRKFYNLWSVYLDGDIDSSGYYIEYDDQMIYFLNEGVTNYRVGYFDSDFMEEINNSHSFLFNSPFYAGSTFKYQYNGRKLFLSASWTFYMVVGFGSFGNGVLHNNIDVLSESSFNPNLNGHKIGRLDSDRSLAGRLMISYRLSDRLSFAFQFKYKDGQSFTSNLTLTDSDGDNNQIAAWYVRAKGDNPFTGDIGSRKDAFFDSALRIVYNGTLKGKEYSVNLSCYNIIDFGTELAEYIYPPDYTTHRYVLELNIPRGIMVTMSYKF